MIEQFFELLMNEAQPSGEKFEAQPLPPLTVPHAPFLHRWAPHARQANDEEYQRTCRANEVRVNTLIHEVEAGHADASSVIELYKRFGADNEMTGSAPLMVEMADRLEDRAAGRLDAEQVA